MLYLVAPNTSFTHLWFFKCKYAITSCGQYFSSHEKFEYSIVSKESPKDVLGDKIHVLTS